MTALRASTASLLLDRLPDNDRARVVEQVAQSLDGSSGVADVGFAAALLQLQPNDNAKSALLAHLRGQVQCGEDAQVAELCEQFNELRDIVYDNIVEFVVNTASRLNVAGLGWMTAPLSSAQAKSDLKENSDESILSTIEQAKHSLRFVCRVAPSCRNQTAIWRLLEACMILTGATDQQLSAQAQESLSVLLNMPGLPQTIDQAALWARVQSLLASPTAYYKTVGFSLWLRWCISAHAPGRSVLQTDEYWAHLVEGLGKGDGERRKAALQILRASVQIVLQDPWLLATITTASSRNHSPTAIQSQFERYCTVFETIVFGRYLNQVQECEADLDFLSSESSVIKPIWLYTLLSSALDQRLQDSNKRFIGSWIMRSNPRTDDVNGYLRFFRTAFLPWVTGSSMFTGTIRKGSNGLYCAHGESLSLYVSQLLQQNRDIAGGIVDCILDSVIGRHGNNFAYAVVHLVDGIGKACEASDFLNLNDEQLEKLSRIATWAGFPEIARDYILARAWQLCYAHIREPQEKTHSEIVTTTASHWPRLQEWSSSLRDGASAHVDGNIGSLALPPSKRDQYEQRAIQKCLQLVATVEQQSSKPSDLTKYEEVVDDIFNDLDYLEYPKSLSTLLPAVISNEALVRAALRGSSESGSNLADVLRQKMTDLVGLTEVRSYMLSPFASTVRDVVLRHPSAASIIPLEHMIIRLCENPPGPTTDAQLEDATVPVLQSLDASLRRLDFDFYFSPRESIGFAALLDIVNRLGNIALELNRQIFESLLQRWRNQKTPPPSVSLWKTALQLQVMLLCLEQLLPVVGTTEATSILRDLHHILAIEPLPRYRYLLEFMIARTYIHKPELRSIIFAELATKDHHSNPKFLASLMKLSVMIAKTEFTTEDFAGQLAALFVPMAASSKVVIRHEAQWQIPLLMDLAREKHWTSISESPAFKALDDFIRSLERFGDPPRERLVDRLDAVTNLNLTHLVEGEWWELDTIEQRQISRDDFLRIYAGDKQHSTALPDPCLPLGDALPPRTVTVNGEDSVSKAVNERKILQNIDNISRSLGSGPVAVPTAASTALQTKGAAYLESSRTRFANLLVVASLVDNPYNLGGLSRVSEIFGAGEMLMTSTNVTSNKDFTNVSVSSHLHLPIRALAPAAIPEFLSSKKRQEGYKVVGIEQTDRSVLLGAKDCILPDKCILVMGSEREGIPALVLAECDVLVEIRQIGVTRSLNVQTACGIVLSEWVRQHGK